LQADFFLIICKAFLKINFFSTRFDLYSTNYKTPFRAKMRYFILFISFTFLHACNRNEISSTKASVSDTIRQKDSLYVLKRKAFENVKIESSFSIREILENRLAGERYKILDEELYSSVLLPRFYTENEFMPFWVSNYNDFDLAIQMINFIEDIEFHGLNPVHYHFDILKNHISALEKDSFGLINPVFLGQLDLFLSDAFFMLSSHIYHGKVDPESLETQWGIQRNKPELKLDQKLRSLSETQDVSQLFKSFYPPHPGYEKMVAEAKRLKSIESNDFTVSIQTETTSIKPGEKSDDIVSIKEKLSFLGLYEIDSSGILEEYDQKTVEAIQKLQKLFGYNTDGKIGVNTIKALNMPVSHKLKQLYVNMERLRWLPDSLEKRYLLANIADFSLLMFDGADTILKMKTIVGKEYRETPVFYSKINYLVFSPSWTVPPGIMQKDIIPEVSKDVNYLARKNMKVFDYKGNIIDPTTINWKKNGMNYTVRQAPGSQNSLGKVKFMFPNKFNVYLHDTPSRNLFWRDERTFSSGCIRIEKPFELAKVLLENMPGWTEEKIKSAMNSSVEKTVILKSSVGIYLYYLTAWATNNGEIHYRSDIYDRDEVVFESLKQKK
jgi:L,D-transpeptidase YcbB